MSGDGLPYYGRCRSGNRWFWYAAVLFNPEERCYDPVCRDGAHPHAYGKENTEEAAIKAMYDAIRRFKPGWQPDPLHKDSRGAGIAARALKQINIAKRAARPASGETDSAPTEYLWYPAFRRSNDYDYGSTTYPQGTIPIVKKTAKRVYYLNGPDRGYGTGPDIGYIDRIALERDGMVKLRSARWWDDVSELYLTEEGARESTREWRERLDRPSNADEAPDLQKLRLAAANAHPDRGGTNEAFAEAFRRYKQATEKES